MSVIKGGNFAAGLNSWITQLGPEFNVSMEMQYSLIYFSKQRAEKKRDGLTDYYLCLDGPLKLHAVMEASDSSVGDWFVVYHWD